MSAEAERGVRRRTELALVAAARAGRCSTAEVAAAWHGELKFCALVAATWRERDGEQNVGVDAECDVRWRIETLEEDKSR